MRMRLLDFLNHQPYSDRMMFTGVIYWAIVQVLLPLRFYFSLDCSHGRFPRWLAEKITDQIAVFPSDWSFQFCPITPWFSMQMSPGMRERCLAAAYLVSDINHTLNAKRQTAALERLCNVIRRSYATKALYKKPGPGLASPLTHVAKGARPNGQTFTLAESTLARRCSCLVVFISEKTLESLCCRFTVGLLKSVWASGSGFIHNLIKTDLTHVLIRRNRASTWTMWAGAQSSKTGWTLTWWVVYMGRSNFYRFITD